MDIAVLLRTERFQSDFFTEISQKDATALLKKAGMPTGGGFGGGGHATWQEIQSLIHPVVPEGYGGGGQQVEELEAQTTIKGQHLLQVVDNTFQLLANDFNNAARWMDIRKAQDPNRTFGKAPQMAQEALRKAVPPQEGFGTPPAGAMTVLAFMKSTPASTFYSSNVNQMLSEIPRAGGGTVE
jgi:histidine ammonia-lyase